MTVTRKTLKMEIKRALYLGYYLKQLDSKKFSLFLNHASEKTKKSTKEILSDILKSVLVYNISILEYFQFRFFELDEEQRKKWAGTGYMYEYQLKMNPPNVRQILENKILFYQNYSDFFIHTVANTEDLQNKPRVADNLLSNSSGKIVLKPVDGNCGTDVKIKNCEDFDRESIVTFMQNTDYSMVEEFVEQHPELNRLSPSAVNTVRIITQLNQWGGVDILGCRLRISVDSSVDNMAAGNLAAPIDEDTGLVSGPAVYSDITKSDQQYHPVTNVEIPGFQIPFWKQTLQMVKQAALLHPQNRSIGWDVVITERGPGLIEGNHDWCKLLWQLPVKKGLKPLLQKYTGETSELTVNA